MLDPISAPKRVGSSIWGWPRPATEH